MTATRVAKKPIQFTTIYEPDGRMMRVDGVYPKPKPERIRSTPQMREALKRQREEELERNAEIERVLREETRKIRITRTIEEHTRIETTRTEKIEQFTQRTDKLVLTTDRHTREVRRVATIVAKLEKDQRITRDLAIYLHQFAQRVADGHGAATEDGDDATSRLTSAYEPGGGRGGFGSKTLSDRQLTGLAALQEMKKRIPRELMPVFDQVIDEEVSGWHDRAKTLSEIGEMIGYKHKQQSAAGGALVYAVTCLIAHFMREKRAFGETQAYLPVAS